MEPLPSASESRRDLAALLLLVILLVATSVWLWTTGSLEAVRVPDTPSYMEASRVTSLKAALSHHRTAGLPTLIRSLYAVGSSRDAIPVLGLLLYHCAVLLFFFAVRSFSGSSWLAFAAALPLPFAGVLRLIGLLQPDFLSAACVLVAIGCLPFVVMNPGNWPAWIGLGLGVLLAYQFRPAAQFMVLLVPVLAGVFAWLVGRSRRSALGLAAATGAVTLIPFSLFCTLRLATVGNFGLVSFGGSNLAASVVNFLDTRLVDELPVESRDLARRILRQRRQRGWSPMRLDSDPIEHFRQGSDNLFRIARNIAKQESRRAARRPGAPAPDPEININVDVDRRLTRLAVEIIRLRPVLYLNWIRHAVVYGLRQLVDYVWIVVPSLLLVVSLPIAWFRRRAKPVTAAEPSTRPEAGPNTTLAMLSILAVAYFSAYLLLVSATFFPFDRYFVSLTLFIPSALTAALFEIWRRILRPDCG